MKTILLLLFFATSFLNAFSKNEAVVIIPEGIDGTKVSVCMDDTVQIQIINLGEYASISKYYTSPVEPDLVNWSNNSQWTLYNSRDTVFSHVVRGEVYIWAVLYDLGTVSSNYIHVTALGTIPNMVYSDTSFCSGSTMTLSTNPNNLESGNYKWFKNSTEVETEILSDIEISESGKYKVLARDVNGACPTKFITSDEVQFYLTQPEISGVLKSYLNKLVLSTEDIYTSYQWYAGSERNNISQVSNTTISYDAQLTDNDMYYALAVETVSGCFAMSDTFLVNNRNYGIPEIYAPEILDICIGESLELSTDGFYGSYQWYRGNIIINGENSSKIVLTDKYPYGEGTYKVIVTPELDPTESMESDTIQVSIIKKPLIYNSTGAYCLGSEITFYTPNNYDSYQWYLNDKPSFDDAIEVGTGDSAYSFTVIEDEVFYMLRTSHVNCADYQYSGSVSVKPYEYISSVSINTIDNNLSQKVCYGDSVKLSTYSIDAEPHWYFNGNLIDSIFEKTRYVKEYGNYTLSVNSTKCPELDPILSDDTVTVGSRMSVNYSVTPGGEYYYYNNDSTHLIYCVGDPVELEVDNANNYSTWQWMGKLYNETSTSDEWVDMEGENNSIYAFEVGTVAKLRFKVRVDSVMADNKICTGMSDSKIIDSWVYQSPEFYAPDNNTNQLCGEGDSIKLELAFPGMWGKYEWYMNGVVLPNSNSPEYYAKDTGYYQIGAYFEKCIDASPARSGTLGIVLFNEATIIVSDDKLVGMPDFSAIYTWYYSSTNPEVDGEYFLDNMIPVDSDTLLFPREIPFDQAPSGYYALQVVNADYCVQTSDIYEHNVVGVNEQINKSVNIYPNPVKDILNFELSNYESVEFIKIFSASGILLQNISKISSQFSISMTNLESGIYFIKIDYSNSDSVVKRIIVE